MDNIEEKFKEFLKQNNHLTAAPEDGDFDAHTMKAMEIAFIEAYNLGYSTGFNVGLDSDV